MVAIPDEFLKSAVFLCVEEQAEDGAFRKVPKATAFMAATVIDGTSIRIGYFVTARHCIYEAKAEGHNEIYLRLNKKTEDGFEDIPTKIDAWFTSDTDDVAVLLFAGSYLPAGKTLQRDFEVNAFPVEQFVGGGPDYKLTLGGIDGYQIKEIQPREGNEIYFVGLFTQSYGQHRNLPIARFGHISRMPSVIDFEDPGHPSYQSIAYLAEFHSWGGHSGSPVYFWEPQTFVAVEVDAEDKPTGRYRQDHGHIAGFLGLISHHYDISKQAKVTGELGTVEMALNSGIAVVVPADAIRTLLERPDIGEHRNEVLKGAGSKPSVPTPDFAATVGPAVDITKGMFEDAVRGANRRYSPSSELDEAPPEDMR